MSAEGAGIASKITAKLDELTRARARLLLYPQQISEVRTRAATAKQDVKQWTENLANVSGELLLEIQNETVTEGVGDKAKSKARFTNDPARQAELARRLGEDAEARTYQAKLTAAENIVRAADLDIRRLEDEQKAWEKHVAVLMKEADLIIASVALAHVDVAIHQLMNLNRSKGDPS